jgi:antitoxin component YwqK of YwqJK toxin-antitoxin module
MKEIFYLGIVLIVFCFGCGQKRNEQIIITSSKKELKQLLENDKFYGVILYNDENGKLKEQYIKTLENQVTISYESVDADVINIARMEVYDSKFNGSSISFYPSGQIQFYYQFNLKRKNGDCVKFWDNGLISEINRYKIIDDKDFLNEQINFYKDGQIKVSSQFVLTEFIKRENKEVYFHIEPIGNTLENSFYRIILAGQDTLLAEEDGFYISLNNNDTIFKAIVEEVSIINDTRTNDTLITTQQIKRIYLDYINK